MKARLTWRIWFGFLIGGYLVALTLFCVMDRSRLGTLNLLKNVFVAAVAPTVFGFTTRTPNYPLKFSFPKLKEVSG